MKMTQKSCLIRHLVRESWLALYQIETIISNSGDFRNTDVGKIFGRVQGVIVKWLPAPFVCNSWEQDLY
jgi:hypothetical protein